MSQQRILVTPDQLRDASTRLTYGKGNIDNTLRDLSNRVNALRDAFQGAASDQFNQYWMDWHDAANKLNEALGNLATMTNKAAEQFEAQDKNIASLFNNR